MTTKTISDSLAKTQCKKYLEKLGYYNTQLSKNSSCDLFAYKNNTKYMFEIKYSSRKEGDEYFGTVMFSELFQAVNNKTKYYFIVCRGNKNNLNNWFYKIFSFKKFLNFCTLTTPIGHYRLKFDKNKIPIKNKVVYNSSSVKINEKMIYDIWKKYREWKPEKIR